MHTIIKHGYIHLYEYLYWKDTYNYMSSYTFIEIM